MLAQFPSGGVVASEGRDIDRGLLANTQDYLEARCQGKTPSPGQVEAWERFYLACTPQIDLCIATFPISEEDRRDCVQEVWKAIITKPRRFRHDPRRGQLSTWLRALVRNKAVDVIRRRRRNFSESLDLWMNDSLPGRELDPSAECERDQLRAAVREALEKLSTQVAPKSYEVLCLRWIEGRTVPDIAVALDLTPEQVYYRHHRVMQKFRQIVETMKGERGEFDKTSKSPELAQRRIDFSE